jgi:hypothetical protein
MSTKNENQKTAVIIFSKDRALQLHATLSSLKYRLEDYEKLHVYVLYKTTKYWHQYDELIKEFKEVTFLVETTLVSQIFYISKRHDYLMFVTDDTMFYLDFSIEECTYHLTTQKDAIGFSLRVGNNINWWHIGNIPIECPELFQVGTYINRFRWPGEQKDFGYPLEVSSSIYRSDDIIPLLDKVHGDPGSIESYLNQQKGQFVKTKPYLLCFNVSVAFAAPVNIVRATTRCPHGRQYSYSIDELVKIFDEGKRIDIQAVPKLVNACHQEMEYKFI